MWKGARGTFQSAHGSQTCGGSAVTVAANAPPPTHHENASHEKARNGTGFMRHTLTRLERQAHVVLGHAPLRRFGLEQVLKLGLLHAFGKGVAGESMQLEGHPPREPLGSPDAP